MEILLIDIGALAVFLGYIALVYWHGISHEADPAARKPGAAAAHYLDRESATARSARSSVEMGQCASHPMQYASISAPDCSSSASSSRAYPVSMRSRPHFGHSDENGA